MTTCAVYVWLLRGYLSIFFQAEDGIRDRNVTGVQTCALPIAAMGGAGAAPAVEAEHGMVVSAHRLASEAGVRIFQERSEERRVGKESRRRWWRGQVLKEETVGGRWRAQAFCSARQ